MLGSSSATLSPSPSSRPWPAGRWRRRRLLRRVEARDRERPGGLGTAPPALRDGIERTASGVGVAGEALQRLGQLGGNEGTTECHLGSGGGEKGYRMRRREEGGEGGVGGEVTTALQPSAEYCMIYEIWSAVMLHGASRMSEEATTHNRRGQRFCISGPGRMLASRRIHAWQAGALPMYKQSIHNVDGRVSSSIPVWGLLSASL